MKNRLFAQMLMASAVALGATAIVSEPSHAGSNNYFCAQLGGIYTTFVSTPRGTLSIIKWVYYSTPEWPYRRRCIEVSNRFQRFLDNGTLRYIGTGIVNNQPVLCAVSSQGDSCNSENLLVTLPQGTDPDRAAQELLDLRALAAGRTISLTGSDKLATFTNGHTYINMEQLLNIAPVENASVTPERE